MRHFCAQGSNSHTSLRGCSPLPSSLHPARCQTSFRSRSRLVSSSRADSLVVGATENDQLPILHSSGLRASRVRRRPLRPQLLPLHAVQA